jgi:hypothetical protein
MTTFILILTLLLPGGLQRELTFAEDGVNVTFFKSAQECAKEAQKQAKQAAQELKGVDWELKCVSASEANPSPGVKVK